jgi:hypothetical protein
MSMHASRVGHFVGQSQVGNYWPPLFKPRHSISHSHTSPPMTSRLFVAPTKPILRASLRSLPSNGHDAFIPQIRKMIFEYCETWPTSTNMRTYILNHLEDLARQNPYVEIVVKHRPHREPIVRGLYCESHYFWKTDGDVTDLVTRSEHPRQSYRSERLRGQWNTEESRVTPRFIWSEDQAAERQPSCGEYDGSGQRYLEWSAR